VPPAALVARLAQHYLDSGGDLLSVYQALLEAGEPWRHRTATAITENFVASLRWTSPALRGAFCNSTACLDCTPH
jgi:uncharacterized protein (DUF1800 family)